MAIKTLNGRVLMVGIDPTGNPIVLKLNADGTVVGAGSGSTTVSNFPADQKVHDDYQAGECTTDLAGNGASQDVTFGSAVQLILVEAVGSGTQVARCDPFGGTPTASRGIRCDDGVPTYIPITATTIKIFAPAGMAVSVTGFRRA